MDAEGKRAGALTALAVAYLGYAGLTLRRGLPSVCPTRLLTGHRCPLCGLSTGIGHALHGELRQAARAHPLSLSVLLVALLYIGAGMQEALLLRWLTWRRRTWRP